MYRSKFFCSSPHHSFDIVRPNPFDLLWPNNLASVFGRNILFWWIPINNRDDELWLQKLPQVKPCDKLAFKDSGNKMKDVKDMLESDTDLYAQKAMKKYSNVNFVFPKTMAVQKIKNLMKEEDS